jgi:sugar O-acyltransferase (sialic acid O-acetyltransferase NeuD family)
MTVLPWVVFGARPGYSAELVEIIGRRRESVDGCVDNLDPGERDSFARRASAVRIAVGGGSGGLRQALARDAQSLGAACFPALVDPTAVIAHSASLSEGATINALVVIAANASIGRFVQVNRSASIGHDVVMGDYSSTGPGAVLASAVTVDRGALIGAGAVVLPGVHIGRDSVVGAGAVVVSSVQPGHTVVGNPARPLARPNDRVLFPLDEGW